ncbi:MAG: hypothetical protein NTW14_09270 [bacterium]|nr:hypothetical protein [bacterium]
MKCKIVRAQLLQLFDEGGLSKLSADLRTHLEGCKLCAAELQQLAELRNGLARIPSPEPAELFWINFLPKLNWKLETALRRKTKDFAWIPSLAATVVFTLFLIKTPILTAPPGWINNLSEASAPSTYAGIFQSAISSLDTVELAAALQDTSILNQVIDSDEGMIALQFSEPISYQPDDPIDQLSALDDDAITAIISALQQKSIIHS